MNLDLKKLLVLIAALVALVAVGCGGDDEGEESTESTEALSAEEYGTEIQDILTTFGAGVDLPWQRASGRYVARGCSRRASIEPRRPHPDSRGRAELDRAA